MAKSSKKTQNGKRPYAKKSNFWKNKNSNFSTPRSIIEEVTPEDIKIRPVDNEVNELIEVCAIINGWDEEQKERGLKFIVSKYGMFI